MNIPVELPVNVNARKNGYIAAYHSDNICNCGKARRL